MAPQVPYNWNGMAPPMMQGGAMTYSPYGMNPYGMPPYGFLPQPHVFPTPAGPLPPNGVIETRNIPEGSKEKFDQVLLSLNNEKDASKLLELARQSGISLTVGNTTTLAKSLSIPSAGLEDNVLYDPNRNTIVISEKTLGTLSERDLANYLVKGLALSVVTTQNAGNRLSTLEREMAAEWLGRTVANRLIAEGDPKLDTSQQAIVNYAKARWGTTPLKGNDTSVEYLNRLGINLEAWIEPSANTLAKANAEAQRSPAGIANGIKGTVKYTIKDVQQSFVNAFDLLTQPNPDVGRFNNQVQPIN
jgi:hypothetical protein